MSKPLLLLQMQRMGDLILSYPLMLWLARERPGARVFVAAEPVFYEGLLKISPEVVYFPWTEAERLREWDYELILNLSHRPEAAALAGRLAAEEKLGPLMEADGAVRIRGDWQLYRASLAHNNRSNHYHWADLNALDAVPLSRIAQTRWERPAFLGRELLKVGLFLGASQEEKRPGAVFWAALVRELARRGLTVVLLGGPAEAALGREVMELCGGVAVNACGRLQLSELALFLGNLALVVTPDTGPMHLAAYCGRRVLNLSMGPVSPWETGPYQPGGHVLTARMSCRGCWQCRRERPVCRDRFAPERVGYLAWRLARGEEDRLEGFCAPGLSLSRVGRNARGLYHLEPAAGEGGHARRLTGDFWAEAFGHAFGLWDAAGPVAAWDRLVASRPEFSRVFGRAFLRLGGEIKEAVRRGTTPDADFWRRFPPCLRPLTGYLHLFLQNGDFRPEAWRRGLALVERVLGLTGR